MVFRYLQIFVMQIEMRRRTDRRICEVINFVFIFLASVSTRKKLVLKYVVFSNISIWRSNSRQAVQKINRLPIPTDISFNFLF